ncbi:MAG: hypothetical protein M3440_15525 [Chloroflexota bacterium]|nr:hypothetical protein [Chloroflexota bacterium]
MSCSPIGGGFGNLFGGLVYDLGRNNGLPALPWMVFSAIGIATGLGLLLNKHRFSAVRDHATVARAEPKPASPPLVTKPRPSR